MEISKKLFRKTLLQYRKLLAPEVYDHRNEAAINRLLDFLLQQGKKYIHVFLSMKKNKEPDILPILPKLWEAGFQTVTSKTDFEEKTMHHYAFDASIALIENSLGIPEPLTNQEVDPNRIELILIPLLLADEQGNRIGYGGGYYDRLLKETKAIKVGLSLSNPVNILLQTDRWDIPLDYLITPFKIYKNG